MHTRILEEDKHLEKQINDILNEWQKSKPVSGKQKPTEAISILTSFEEKYKRLKEEQENLVRAKTALDINDSFTNINSNTTARLDAAIEELTELLGE